MYEKTMTKNKRISISLATVILLVVTIIGSSNVFAVSASISPSSQTRCENQTANWTLHMGTDTSWTWYFDFGDGSSDFDIGVTYTSYPESAGFDGYGSWDQSLDVEDAHGYAHSTSHTVIRQSGVGGCPI